MDVVPNARQVTRCDFVHPVCTCKVLRRGGPEVTGYESHCRWVNHVSEHSGIYGNPKMPIFNSFDDAVNVINSIKDGIKYHYFIGLK